MRSLTIPFQPDGLEMTGELVLPEDPSCVAVLCHGIPGPANPADSKDARYAGMARTLASAGHAGFWFDFRGTRGSPGDFSIGGWRNDLMAACDALRASKIAGELPLLLVGSSAGGAVSILVAAHRGDIAGVATLAAPAHWGFSGDSPDRVLARLRNAGLIREPTFPLDQGSWFREMETLSAVSHVAGVSPATVLIMHGDADEVVPYRQAEALFAAASAPKELARIPDGGHQLRNDPRAIDCLLDWISRLAGQAPR